MKLRKVIDDYVECNKFEIKIIDKKVKVYYYDSIERFTSSIIVISTGDDLISVKGNNLIIETMFKEYMVISGKIKTVELNYINE